MARELPSAFGAYGGQPGEPVAAKAARAPTRVSRAVRCSLMAALPAPYRGEAERTSERVLVDPVRWMHGIETASDAGRSGRGRPGAGRRRTPRHA